MVSSLSRKVGDSVTLLFFRKIWSNVVNLLVMTILARLLTKEDFGLLAISAVLLSFINTVGTGGLSDYLIYYTKKDSKQIFSSVFWLNLFLTIGVSGVVLIAAPFWSSFYGSDKIQKILWLLVFNFFFEMISMVPRTVLRKEFQYNILVQYSTIFMTLVSGGKLLCAYGGAGAYSLVIPQAVLSPFLAIAFFFKTGFVPFRDFGIRYYGRIIRYGRHLLGGKIISKFVNEGDNLIIGKLLGLEALGVYNLAFQLANLVTTNVVLVVSDVILPILSKIKNEPERLRKIFLNILGFLSLISFPLITTLAAFAKPLILFVYGEAWMDAALLLQILCLFAIGRSINSPSSLLYNALGRPDIGFKFSLYFAPIFLTGIVVGSYFGIVGVAIAASVTRFGGQLFSTSLAFSLAKIHSIRFYVVIGRNLFLSILLIILVSTLFSKFNTIFNTYTQLFLVPLFVYLYALLMRLFAFEEVKNGLAFMGAQKAFSRVIPIFTKLLFVKL